MTCGRCPEGRKFAEGSVNCIYYAVRNYKFFGFLNVRRQVNGVVVFIILVIHSFG